MIKLEKGKSVLKGTMIFTFSNMLTKVGAILILPLITLYLTPTEFGAVSILIPIAQMVSLVCVGGLYIHQSRQYVHLKEDRNRLGSYLFSINIFIIIFGILIVLVAVSPMTHNILDDFLEENILAYISLYIIAGIINSLAFLASSYFQQERRYAFIASVSVGAFVVDCVLTVILLKQFNLGIVGRNIAYITWAIILFCFFYFPYIRRFKFPFYKDDLSDALKVSVPVIFSSIFGYIINFSDRIILGYYLDLEVVGAYSLAYSGSLLIMVLISSFNSAWIPYFNEQMKKDRYHPILEKTLYIILLIFSFIISIGVLYGNSIVNLFFGEDYQLATVFLPTLIAVMIFQGVYHYLVLFFNYNKNTITLALISICSALINILINIIFIPIYGAQVALWSTFISMFISVLFLFILIRIKYLLKFKYLLVTFLLCTPFISLILLNINWKSVLISNLVKLIYLLIISKIYIKIYKKVKP